MRPPTIVEVAYRTSLLTLLASVRARVEESVLPRLPDMVARAQAARMDAKDDGKRLNEMFDRISERVYKEWDPNRLTKLAKKIATRTSDLQKAELGKALSSQIGIDPTIALGGDRQRIRDFTAENVALIKSIPQQYLDRVEATVTRGVSSGQRHEQIAEQIAEDYGVSQRRAELIARDQTLSFYGSLNAARQQALGVDKYIWRSVSDERVRNSHSDFDGNTYSWDDPPGDGSAQEGTHPATAINCRCFADPILEDLLP